MPKKPLKSGFSAISAHKRPPLQSNSAAGVYVFYGDCGFLHRCNRNSIRNRNMEGGTITLVTAR